ncbi:MAG: acyl-CoA thioesterase [Deltaproteobacteria bacterium]|nr:acyl-CoA thioesterase [Deltaproteobacteria bacterium]
MKSTTKITVRSYHVDHFGHVNHARYVELLEEARWRYLEENQLLEPIHQVGAFHVVAKITLQYRHPACVGEILRFETQIGSRSTYGFQVDQKAYLKDSEKLVVNAMILNVFIDPEGQPRLIDQNILGIWPDLAKADKME